MCERCLPRQLSHQSRRTLLKTAMALPIAAVLPFGRGVSASSSNARNVADGLSIRPRADWAGDDRPPKGGIQGEDVRFLLVHHTAGSNNYSEESVAGQIRGMYDFHTGPEKGWPDVAYNFLIDRFGGVWEARAGSLAGGVSGSATGGNQGYSQLVSLMGDFSSQLPTDDALASLRQTLAWLADRHGLDTTPTATTEFESKGSNRHSSGSLVSTTTINGHRSMSQTSCPGEALFGYVSGDLMADVSALRNGAPQPPSSQTTGPATTESPTTEPATTEPPTTEPPTTEPPTTEPPTTEPLATTAASATAETTLPASSSVSPPVGDTDTVQAVAAPSPTEQRDASNQSLSAIEGLGLAGAAAVAAVGGLVAVRKREGDQAS